MGGSSAPVAETLDLNERMGELLVKENLLTTEQLRKAREEAKTGGQRLGAQITKLGYLEENELSEFVARQYGVPDINLEDFDIDPAVIQLIPEDVALKHTVIPVNRAAAQRALARLHRETARALERGVLAAIDDSDRQSGVPFDPDPRYSPHGAGG